MWDFNYSTIYLFTNSSAVQKQESERKAEELKQKQEEERKALELKVQQIDERINGIVVQQKEAFKKIDVRFDEMTKLFMNLMGKFNDAEQ